MSDKIIAIAGYSGHAFVVSDAAYSAGIELSHYTDINKSEFNPYQLDYLGFEFAQDFFDINPNVEFILGIGDNTIRNKVFQLFKSKGVGVLNVVHCESFISNNVIFGEGNFISKNASINPLVKIGNACIINTGAIVEHECEIEDAVHIAPGVVLAGGVKVGKGTMIGANAVVLPGVKIGANCILGAGSVVLRDVPDNSIGYGNPMIIKKKR